MAKMHGHYFGRGRKIMTRYFRRNASGLLLYFAYSIARIVGDVLLILLPVFATSSFNSAHMLKETGDLYLSKSFDHAEDEKSYRSLLLFAAVVVLGAGALIAGLIFLVVAIVSALVLPLSADMPFSLEAMGLAPKAKVLPPHIVQFLANKLCLDV